DVACNGEDNELCQDWQKVSGWVQLGLISATGADLLYQTLKKSSKLQDEVLRLGGVDNILWTKIDETYPSFFNGSPNATLYDVNVTYQIQREQVGVALSQNGILELHIKIPEQLQGQGIGTEI